MARQARVAPAGQIYHVMNRAVGRFVMMRKDEDFMAFERVMIQAHEREPLPILAYCLMGNHWHFVVKPKVEGQLASFFRWLTLTHAVRWRVAHRTVGYGHLYGGRYKSFMVQPGGRLLEVLRYVERNALSADLVSRAEDWRWSSLWARSQGAEGLRAILSEWPGGRPAGWEGYVNEAMTKTELSRLKLSESRGRPYGEDRWVGRLVSELGLQYTIRDPWRPAKAEDK